MHLLFDKFNDLLHIIIMFSKCSYFCIIVVIFRIVQDCDVFPTIKVHTTVLIIEWSHAMYYYRQSYYDTM